mgnify:CR=1 FL=1|tara:strand:+ start:620 stop:1171 length:552 start_codon:yes stop_codon:yes gene_type:complete
MIQTHFKDNWLTVGKLVAPQGVKGLVRVNPTTEFSERFTKEGKRWICKENEEPKEIKLLGGKKLPGKLLYVIQIEGITTREKAYELVGAMLLVPSNDRPKLKKNEFHFLDLVGLEVKVESSRLKIGVVTDLIKAGNDLLEVQLTEGRKVLIPFVKEIVPLVNIKEGWISITPPDGLLDISSCN